MILPADYRPKYDFLSQPQNIRFLRMNPCAASPYIYIETALPVAGEALLQLLTFGLSDVLIGYAHPKLNRGWRRTGKGNDDRRELSRDGEKRRLRGKGFPEIGNELGKKLPGSAWIRAAQKSPKFAYFWVPVDIIEHGLFWFMIADIARSSIYNWSSDIFKASCADRNKKHPTDRSGYFGGQTHKNGNFIWWPTQQQYDTEYTIHNATATGNPTWAVQFPRYGSTWISCEASGAFKASSYNQDTTAQFQVHVPQGWQTVEARKIPAPTSGGPYAVSFTATHHYANGYRMILSNPFPGSTIGNSSIILAESAW